MKHPLAFIPTGDRKPVFFTGLAITLILFAIFRILDQPLRTEAAPNGIISFELAGTPQTARLITDSWKQLSLLLSAVAGQSDPAVVNIVYVFAAFGLGIDYLFMPVYGLTLAMSTLLAMLASQRRSGLLHMLGPVAGYAALAALPFDALENYALLQVLLGHVQSSYPAIAAGCALLKFGLILFALSYALIGGLLSRS